MTNIRGVTGMPSSTAHGTKPDASGRHQSSRAGSGRAASVESIATKNSIKIRRIVGGRCGQQPSTGTRHVAQKPSGTGGADTHPGIAQRPSASRCRMSASRARASSAALTEPLQRRSVCDGAGADGSPRSAASKRPRRPTLIAVAAPQPASRGSAETDVSRPSSCRGRPGPPGSCCRSLPADEPRTGTPA